MKITRQDRYAAKLLFQFRVMIGDDPGIRRLCEERIIVFEAPSTEIAIQAARMRGSAAEHDYENDDGYQVYFELVGIRDMICLGAECESDEVWYDIFEKVRPMEKALALTMSDERLTRRITGTKDA
jgi:Domain of unknown function (DUF4288)